MAGTSRRPHVVTPQRRNVGSTNIKVNKRQRRDVSASSASPSLKAKRGPEFEASGDHTNEGTEIRAVVTLILKKGSTFVSSSFRIEVLMFYRLTICVLIFSMF